MNLCAVLYWSYKMAFIEPHCHLMHCYNNNNNLSGCRRHQFFMIMNRADVIALHVNTPSDSFFFFFVRAEPALIWWFIMAVHYLQTQTDRSLIQWSFWWPVCHPASSELYTAASENSKFISADWQPGHVALEGFLFLGGRSNRVHINCLEVTGNETWRLKAVKNRE